MRRYKKRRRRCPTAERLPLGASGRKTPAAKTTTTKQRIVRIGTAVERLFAATTPSGRSMETLSGRRRNAPCASRGNRKPRLRVRERKRNRGNASDDNPITRHGKTRTVPPLGKIKQGNGAVCRKTDSFGRENVERRRGNTGILSKRRRRKFIAGRPVYRKIAA